MSPCLRTDFQFDNSYLRSWWELFCLIREGGSRWHYPVRSLLMKLAPRRALRVSRENQIWTSFNSSTNLPKLRSWRAMTRRNERSWKMLDCKYVARIEATGTKGLHRPNQVCSRSKKIAQPQWRICPHQQMRWYQHYQSTGGLPGGTLC